MYDEVHNLSLYTRKKYIIRSMLKKHAKKLLADVYKSLKKLTIILEYEENN